MTSTIQNTLKKVRHIVLLIIMVTVWALFFMVVFEFFIPPFDRLIPWLIPSQAIFNMSSELSMTDRMLYMQKILGSSQKMSNIAFFVMMASFIMFSIYLTIVYQQKQRRSRENTLLRLKNQEIARRNEFIRYISATIGHEFKNNIARIKRRLNLISDIPKEVKEPIYGNLDNLFADIKVFKKISDEREEELSEFSEVFLRRMIIDLAERHSDLADVTFQTQFYPPVIYASGTLLGTVFENLFDNAVKYKKPDRQKAGIMVSYSIDRDGKRQYVTLSFKDEGIGMDERQADQCFYKGVESDTGWGEGLYFAKYVIGLHAGKIRVGKEYTAPGVGTEIIINLPFVEEGLDV